MSTRKDDLLNGWNSHIDGINAWVQGIPDPPPDPPDPKRSTFESDHVTLEIKDPQRNSDDHVDFKVTIIEVIDRLRDIGKSYIEESRI